MPQWVELNGCSLNAPQYFEAVPINRGVPQPPVYLTQREEQNYDVAAWMTCVLFDLVTGQSDVDSERCDRSRIKSLLN